MVPMVIKGDLLCGMAVSHLSGRSRRSLHTRKGVAALGIGTFGCRILSNLAKRRLPIDSYNYISCDKNDLENGADGNKLHIDLKVGGKISPAYVRGAATRYTKHLEKLLHGNEVVFIFSGLGGTTGSALSPLIAEMAHQMDIGCFAIASMPFAFEKSKHFNSGVALKRLRKHSDGIIIIDNDELLDSAPQAPILESYNLITKSIGLALSKLLGSDDGMGVSLDAGKLIQMIKNDGYSILGISNSSSTHNRSEESVKRALKSLSKTADPASAQEAILFIAGDKNISPSDLSSSINTVEGVLGKGLNTMEYGFSSQGNSTTTAIILASGFQSTKFDNYDPLGIILSGSEIDDMPDTSLDLEMNLTRLD